MCEIHVEPAEAMVRPISASEGVLATRRFFGLPVDVPIVATGHQPLMPHAGIVAKYQRARAVADAAGGHAVNLVIDTGTERVGELDVPCGHPPDQLTVTRIAMLTEHAGILAFRPPGSLWPANARAWPDGVLETVVPGLEAIGSAWASSSGTTAGEQAASAVGHVLRPYAGQFDVVFASQLLCSPIGEQLRSAMRSDPQGCVSHYNEAVAEFPEAGIRPLEVGAHLELPLWRVAGGTTRPARQHDLENSPAELLPRALVTTALVRAAVADHYVHGLGGWSYDRVMERWISRWLGWSCCPRSLATATLRLPGCSDDDIERALTRRHHTLRRLRHDPRAAGGSGLSREKAALLAAVNSAPAGTAARQSAFGRMHQQMAQSADTAALDRATVEFAAARQSAPIAARRTWAVQFAAPPRAASAPADGLLIPCGPARS